MEWYATCKKRFMVGGPEGLRPSVVLCGRGEPMPASPCIRGTVFAQVVLDVERLLASGAVAQDRLGRWLGPEDLRVMAEDPLVSGWYPIGTYARMNELLRDVDGGGRDDYLRGLGRKSARQFLESGHYQQVGYALRTALGEARTPEERFHAFGYDLRLFVTMSASILNFSLWTPRVDPEHKHRYRIEVTEASALPEALCWRADGFMNELAATHGNPELWRWERAAPDAIVFRMSRPL